MVNTCILGYSLPHSSIVPASAMKRLKLRAFTAPRGFSDNQAGHERIIIVQDTLQGPQAFNVTEIWLVNKGLREVHNSWLG